MPGAKAPTPSSGIKSTDDPIAVYERRSMSITSQASLDRHVRSLDGLRGVAILLVMFSHLIDGGKPGSRLAQLMLGFCHAGWLGVSLFFVLSGYLITGILISNREDVCYFRIFYARRILRIFPLYYTLLAVVFGVLPHVPSFVDGVRQIAVNQGWLWTYTTNVAAARGVFFNAPGVYLEHLWSLAVEEQFYLAWPLLVRFCPPPRLPRACLAVAGLAVVSRAAMALAGASVSAAYMATTSHLDALSLGAWLASEPARVRAEQRLAIPVATLCATSLFVAGTLCGGLRENATELAGTLSVAALLFAAVLVAITGQAASVLTSAFEVRPLRVLGKYSYGMYVLSSFLQPHLERWFSTRAIARHVESVAMASGLHFAAHVTVSFAAAVVSYHALERPFLRLKRYFVYTPSSSQPTSATSAATT